MKRVMALVLAAGALFISLDVGSAQQSSTLRFNATGNDLRVWDQFVTAQERAGALRVAQVVQDPSVPSRTIERLQQYYQGVPVWGAEVVRDSDRGVPVSIFGDLSAQADIDTQPGMTVEAASQLLLSRGASGAMLLRPVTSGGASTGERLASPRLHQCGRELEPGIPRVHRRSAPAQSCSATRRFASRRRSAVAAA
jgi:hypothetical protein